MEKFYTSLGLMSGTSMDGVDASVIKSDGENNYEPIFNKYFEYDEVIYSDLLNLRDKINSIKDLTTNSYQINELERKITLFHAKISTETIKSAGIDVDLVGFHGQTIFHNAQEKISKQIGDGNLLSSLLKKEIVYNFRENDILNGGQGAPLAPIFHNLLINQNQIERPACVLNVGGIANITLVVSKNNEDLKSFDLGPGNCLLDEWVRRHTQMKYDENGKASIFGKTSEVILNQAIDNFDNISDQKKLSFDIKDFDLNFVKGLSYENGLSTLVDFTAVIIYQSILKSIKIREHEKLLIIVCGGGRKNLSLMESIRKRLPKNISLKIIDDYKIDGDFIESQAFAYLAIRSVLKKEISYPNTTHVQKPCTGGVLVKNY
ncbi:anhydro-N-acetylmuramic acid kinase [Candidatus Pelagibacter sp.]|nr:anhydro-N-acetylmuramic acid kinase [Candidatus Pelagibacter sp.]MDB3903157.1 anhydro-N-acetylmuramic acid kinase [Candidatus Pelagibacter sp.]MDC1050156.1 anhydro-N-acetylmuramic acid kinase [Candidatus Pelagibacter sp.]